MGSAEEVFYKEFKYRLVKPLEHQLQCLDVLVKVQQTSAQKIRSLFSSKQPHEHMRLGSMLDEKLMGKNSHWLSAQERSTVNSMRKEVASLDNFLKSPSTQSAFRKRKLQELRFSYSSSIGGGVWLASVAGIDLGKGETLSCVMDGLTAASVEYTTICQWLYDSKWCPNIPRLEMITSDWSKNRNGPRKLWLVTDVLYATQMSLKSSKSLIDKVMAHASFGAPGLNIDAGAELQIKRINDSILQLKAKRNKQFIVGYRTMRVEYRPDGTVELLRKAEDSGLRGDDDDPLRQTLLKEMEEDIFSVDDEGEKSLIELVTPNEEELEDISAAGSSSAS